MLELGRHTDLGGDERALTLFDVYRADEVFLTGTAAEVTAVSEIAQWKFTPAAITKQLMDDYTAEVQPKGGKAAAPAEVGATSDCSNMSILHVRRARYLRLVYDPARPVVGCVLE